MTVSFIAVAAEIRRAADRRTPILAFASDDQALRVAAILDRYAGSSPA
jgi:hypothetical protein